MGIEINVKTYLTFSVCMDFKPSLSAITYYMNDLLICRVSVINSAVLWVHKNVRKKYTSKTWTFIKWSWVFINWTRKGPPSTYKVVRCAGFKPTVCTFEEMGERAVIVWVGGNYFSFPFSLADFVILLNMTHQDIRYLIRIKMNLCFQHWSNLCFLTCASALCGTQISSNITAVGVPPICPQSKITFVLTKGLARRSSWWQHL